MKRVHVFFLSFGIWVALAFAGIAFAAEDPMSAAGILKIKTKLDAPGFMLGDLSGNRVNLQDYQGQVVLLSFWATW